MGTLTYRIGESPVTVDVNLKLNVYGNNASVTCSIGQTSGSQIYNGVARKLYSRAFAVSKLTTDRVVENTESSFNLFGYEEENTTFNIGSTQKLYSFKDTSSFNAAGDYKFHSSGKPTWCNAITITGVGGSAGNITTKDSNYFKLIGNQSGSEGGLLLQDTNSTTTTMHVEDGVVVAGCTAASKQSSDDAAIAAQSSDTEKAVDTTKSTKSTSSSTKSSKTLFSMLFGN